VSETKVLKDLPDAALGQVSVLEWMDWLEAQGLSALKRDGCPSDIVPCAHLVASHPPRDHTDFHWIYRDADGDVHDPSPVFEAMSADDPFGFQASDNLKRDQLVCWATLRTYCWIYFDLTQESDYL
jgi:hypothetical protein